MHLFGWGRNLERKEKAEENPWGEQAINGPSGLKLLGVFHTAGGGKFTLCQESKLAKKKQNKTACCGFAKTTWGLVGTWCSCPPPICSKVWCEGNGGQIKAARLCSESWGTQHPTESVEKGQRARIFVLSLIGNVFLFCFFAEWHINESVQLWQKILSLIIGFRSESTSFKIS